MMLWTLMLGMVQKVLQEGRRAQQQEVTGWIPAAGGHEPKVGQGDSLDEGAATADLGADRVVDLRKNLGVEWMS